jgi:uncharacterized repeat protein (TIGR02543 family)
MPLTEHCLKSQRPAIPSKAGSRKRLTELKVTAETTVKTAEDHTLYAQWEINQYTITFDSDGGTVVDPITQDYGTAITAPSDPTREGYTFKGWDQAHTDYHAGGIQTITAQWTADEYSIIYNLDNGTNHAENPAKYTIETETITLKVATKIGYTFEGWYDAETDGNKVTQIEKGSIGDKIFYAYWTADKYTISFDANGGDTPSSESKQVTYDKTYGDLSTVTRTGYTFQGWFTEAAGGVEVTAETTVATANDHTLYAQWEINTYKVTFSAGANGSLTAEVDETSITSGTNVEHFKKVIFIATPSTGYQVKAWKVNNEVVAGETGVTYTIASLEGAVTVTVEFEKISYTLTYNAGDNGSITGDSSQSVKYGENGSEVTAVPNDGYHFVKWSDDVETAERTDTNVTADITVTAEFAINEYTVTFKDHDGTELKTQKVEHGRAATAPTAPTRTGYTFTGWDKEFTNITGDLTVTAQYTINEYAVTFSAGANGSLTAEVGEESITSGANVEHFKKVIFTATPSTGYQVKEWKVDGSAIEETGLTYTIASLEDAVEVTVEFEKISYTLTYNCGRKWQHYR